MPIATLSQRRTARLTLVPGGTKPDDRHGDALLQLPGGVSLLTIGHAPDHVGVTVNSVTWLPGEPAQVLVPIHRAAASLLMLAQCRSFGISVLASHHSNVAARFNGRSRPLARTRFPGDCWHTLVTGSALLCDALAAVDCKLDEIVERPYFAVVVGRVVAVRTRTVAGPLLYWKGDYHGLPHADEDITAQWEPIVKPRNAS